MTNHSANSNYSSIQCEKSRHGIHQGWEISSWWRTCTLPWREFFNFVFPLLLDRDSPFQYFDHVCCRLITDFLYIPSSSRTCPVLPWVRSTASTLVLSLPVPVYQLKLIVLVLKPLEASTNLLNITHCLLHGA
ncbi:hypothetical protein CDAR_612621 [Caerostris darwini]|uniref:Uncharacterized protein n=1 Tax=Caerostris darwini TaxID=1538125 RepID=A0AAV4SI54_9ARAC|nr:hypothetical protein CDAR_612621 [Caerostris darwini]